MIMLSARSLQILSFLHLIRSDGFHVLVSALLVEGLGIEHIADGRSAGLIVVGVEAKVLLALFCLSSMALAIWSF